MFYIDPGYIIFLMPALMFAMWAQSRVRSVFDEYSRWTSSTGYTGGEVAKALLRRAGLGRVSVEPVGQTLSDHYDPRSKKVNLSREVYYSRSVAAIGVAAHEVGHAIQHGTGYAPLALRNGLLPVAQLGSQAALPLFFMGFLFQMPSLMDLGILFFTGAVAFQVITLPVEYNASSRALAQLREGGYILPREEEAVSKVLSAAALTYVAATAVSVAWLLRLLVLRGRRD